MEESLTRKRRDEENKKRCADYLLQMFEKYGASIKEEAKEEENPQGSKDCKG